MQSITDLARDINRYLCFRHVPGHREVEVPKLDLRHRYQYQPKVLREMLYSATEKLVGPKVDVLLSGGLDSSITLHCVKQVSSGAVTCHTFQYAIEGHEGKDEDVACAKELCEKYGAKHNLIDITIADIWAAARLAIQSIGTPYSGVISAAWMDRTECQFLLTGDLSDELFGSYAGPREAMRSEYGTEYLGYRASRFIFNDEERRDLAPVDAYTGYKLEPLRFLETLCPDRRMCVVDVALTLDWYTILPYEIFEPTALLYNGRSTSPFMDPAVIEYATGLHWSEKTDGKGTMKIAPREAFRGILPDRIINRRKEGFVHPYIHAMRAEGYVEELFRDIRYMPLNSTMCLEIKRRFDDGDDSVAQKLWSICCFIIWWQETMW